MKTHDLVLVEYLMTAEKKWQLESCWTLFTGLSLGGGGHPSPNQTVVTNILGRSTLSWDDLQKETLANREGVLVTRWGPNPFRWRFFEKRVLAKGRGDKKLECWSIKRESGFSNRQKCLAKARCDCSTAFSAIAPQLPLRFSSGWLDFKMAFQ